MILVKDTEGELRLIGNQNLSWYNEYKPIKVLKDLPIELRRTKVTDKLKDIIHKQEDMLETAQKELKLRKKLLKILYALEVTGE